MDANASDVIASVDQRAATAATAGGDVRRKRIREDSVNEADIHYIRLSDQAGRSRDLSRRTARAVASNNAPTTMLAAFYVRPGRAREVFVVDEVNVPVPGPGDVRVRMCVSGVNPADVKRRLGVPGRMPLFPVIIPHSDGAGVIEAVAEDVPLERIGERVWTWNAQWRRPFGTAAEYAVLPSNQAVPLPDNVSFEVGATLGVPALTASRCVTVGGSLAGKTILIAGGAGSVGHYAIQFAKAKGAIVLTTVSSSQKADLALAAGADHVINYKSENLVNRARDLTAGRGVDQIIEVDLAANIGVAPGILKRGGSIVVYGSAADMTPRIPVLAFQVHGISVHFLSGSEQPDCARSAAITEITTMLRENQLKTIIGARFPLREIALAHEAVEISEVIGKVVLQL